MIPADFPGPPTIDDAALDRLVDGDLDDAERRSLLLSLDSEPDGWRRCALAFLEAQSWREAIGDAARSAAPSPPPAAAPPRPRVLRLAPAWAASLAAAFALGWSARPPAPTPEVAHVGPVTPAPPETPAGPEPAAPVVARHSVTPGEVEPPRAAPHAPPEPPPPRHLAATPPDRAAPAVRMVPDYVRGQLERRGYRVEQNRGLMIGVREGRRVAVPVEQVKIRYVGRGTS